MSHYTIRRILLIFPTLFIASLFLALMLRLLPGDAIAAAAGASGRGTSTVRAATELAKAKLGLDKPFHIQYIRWIVGWPREKGAVYHSADGGATWRAIGKKSVKPITNVEFLTPALGWGIREDMIYGTKDGGRQWTSQEVVDTRLNNLHALDEDHLWAVGDQGVLLRTTEGGASRLSAGGASVSGWVRLNSGTETDLYGVSFVGLDKGWAVGGQGTILRTTDGGESWEAQSSGVNVGLASVVFADESNGWVVGDKGAILRTTDGGTTWLQNTGLPDHDLTDIALVNARTLWAVGDDGAVLQTTDGGSTWLSKDIQEGLKDLTSVAFGDASNGVIVGSDGAVLTTTDGGVSWTKRDIYVTRQREGVVETEGPIAEPLGDVSVVVSGSGTTRIWAPSKGSQWEWGLLGGNLGERFRPAGRTVFSEIGRTVGASLQVGIMSLFVAIVVALPIGIISATRQDTWGDYAGRIVAVAGLAVPTFWVGIMVILIPSYYFNWVPPVTYVSFFEDPVGNLYFFMLPSIVAAIPIMAEIMRMTRNMMLEVLRQDYIRTAYSKGMRERFVIYRHALKNAMIPVVTLLGLLVPYQLGGLVVIEQIFNIPGLGRLLLGAIEGRDYPMVQGGAMFIGLVVIVMNLLVDLVYSWLDPRIRYS